MMILMLLTVLAAGGPAVADTGGSVEARLLSRLSEMPYVDTHVHLPDPRGFEKAFKDAKCDPVWLLGQGTYVAEFTAGSTWEEVKKGIELYGNHPYYRVILEAFRDLYGLKPGEDLNDGNIKSVSERMDAAHRAGNEKWYEEVLRKRAKLAHLIWLEGGDRPQSGMPAPWFHPVWNIDGDFVFITSQDAKTKKWQIDAARKALGEKLSNLGEMERVISSRIDGFFSKGGVALKSTAAYFRDLDFDENVPRAKAERLFARVARHLELGAADRRALEDYLMVRVLTAVARNKKPIQFHAGNQQTWNMLAMSNPVGLNRLLYTGKFWDAKFVVLHGGYPYTREAITMTRYFGNCYLDLAWVVLFSPDAARSALAEALDIVPADRLTIGTDTANLEEMYGTIKFTRRVLAQVLAAKVEGGFLTEEAALRLAERVLYKNAMELYGLKD